MAQASGAYRSLKQGCTLHRLRQKGTYQAQARGSYQAQARVSYQA